MVFVSWAKVLRERIQFNGNYVTRRSINVFMVPFFLERKNCKETALKTSWSSTGQLQRHLCDIDRSIEGDLLSWKCNVFLFHDDGCLQNYNGRRRHLTDLSINFIGVLPRIPSPLCGPWAVISKGSFKLEWMWAAKEQHLNDGVANVHTLESINWMVIASPNSPHSEHVVTGLQVGAHRTTMPRCGGATEWEAAQEEMLLMGRENPIIAPQNSWTAINRSVWLVARFERNIVFLRFHWKHGNCHRPQYNLFHSMSTRCIVDHPDHLSKYGWITFWTMIGEWARELLRWPIKLDREATLYCIPSEPLQSDAPYKYRSKVIYSQALDDLDDAPSGCVSIGM